MQPEAAPPGPHPEPPEDLAFRPLPLTTTDGPWFRLHHLEYAALRFGRLARSRFDAPAGEYGMLYCAVDPHCAFVETFGHATG